jgi:DNA mismatch endonuclease (patch repair protein)
MSTAQVFVTDAPTSRRMRSVRQKDTAPELAVRKIVTALGFRYRVRNRDLPGSPDLANRVNGWAIFVHGCFWHGHSRCRKATVPKRNRDFWKSKFADNRRRDRVASLRLRRRGFRTLTVWECQTRDSVSLAKVVQAFLTGQA